VEIYAITLDQSGLVAASEPSIKARGKAYGTGRKGSIEWQGSDLYWNQYGIYSDGEDPVFARVLKTGIVGPETVSSGEYGDLRTSGSDVYKLGQAGTSLKTASATAAADDRPGYLPGQPWRASGSGPLLSYRRKGIRQYELTDHLGNVRAVIGDRLKTETAGTATAYKPELLSATDYFPFGMQMPGRVVIEMPEGYRYGFNGMEKENAVNEDGYDFGARLYNSWNGKWLKTDPDDRLYPSASPYNFALNNPIFNIDPNGRHVVDANGNIVYTKVGNEKNLSEHAGMSNYFEQGINASKEIGYRFDQINIKYQVVHIYANDGTPIPVYVITSVTSKSTGKEIEKSQLLKSVCFSYAAINGFGILSGPSLKNLILKDRGVDKIPYEKKNYNAEDGDLLLFLDNGGDLQHAAVSIGDGKYSEKEGLDPVIESTETPGSSYGGLTAKHVKQVGNKVIDVPANGNIEGGVEVDAEKVQELVR
jgi:RHS repeat-associated protein